MQWNYVFLKNWYYFAANSNALFMFFRVHRRRLMPTSLNIVFVILAFNWLSVLFLSFKIGGILIILNNSWSNIIRGLLVKVSQYFKIVFLGAKIVRFLMGSLRAAKIFSVRGFRREKQQVVFWVLNLIWKYKRIIENLKPLIRRVILVGLVIILVMGLI